MNKTFASRLLCLLLFATLLCGCARRETPVTIGNRDKILHLGNASEPKDLDPHIVTGVTENNIIAALLEGLVAEDPVDLHPVPGVAESWDVAPDGKTYVFHLRADARWSNGDPVTADDFVFSFKRILSPKLGSPYAYMLFALENAVEFNAGKLADFAQVGAQALNPSTLQLKLKDPVPYFLSLLNHYSWFPVHPPTILAAGAIDQMGTRWTEPENFVGNGPFVLKTWEPGKEISVTRSETYWDRATVQLNAIFFYPIGDHNIEERSFRAGQLHVTGTVPIDRIQYYQREKPELLRLDPYLGTYYYLFNVTRPPLDDARVRKALALAIDREQLVRYVTKGGEVPAYFFTPPDTAGYTCTHGMKGTLEDARALLAQAGFPGGKNFPRLELLYNTSDAHERIAQSVQQMWQHGLGITIELVNMEWKVYLAATLEKKYDIARAGWISDYVDPNSFLDMWVTDGGNNRAGWSNNAYDGLIEKASRTVDQQERYEVFQQAEAILMDEMPIVPFYFYRSKSLIQPSVRGWNPTIIDHHPYKYIRLDDGA